MEIDINGIYCVDMRHVENSMKQVLKSIVVGAPRCLDEPLGDEC